MHRFCYRVTNWLYLSPENILNCFLTSWPQINLWHVALWRFFSLSMLVPHAGVSHVAEHWPVVSLDQKQLQSCPYSPEAEIPIQCWFCWLQLTSFELILDPFHVLIIHCATSPLSRYHCLPKKHLLWCSNTHKFCLHINQTATTVSAQFIDSQLIETHSSQ